jgi:predicted DNA-binding transcriptional regulator AlpA
MEKILDLPETLVLFDSLPDSAHVRLTTVCHLYGVSPATVWRAASQGRIPRPVKLTSKTTAWNVGALRQALKAADQSTATEVSDHGQV